VGSDVCKSDVIGGLLEYPKPCEGCWFCSTLAGPLAWFCECSWLVLRVERKEERKALKTPLLEALKLTVRPLYSFHFGSVLSMVLKFLSPHSLAVLMA